MSTDQSLNETTYFIDAENAAEMARLMNQDRITKLLQPFVVKTGVSTQQEVEGLYQQALAEMMSDTYCVVWFYLTVAGEKP